MTHAKSIKVFLRQIHAAHFKIVAHIANDIRHLKREAEPLCEIGRARIAKTENMQTGKPHGSGHAVAIFSQAVERGVGTYCKIHLRAQDQIVEIARRDFKPRNRIRQGGENCVPVRSTRDSVIEHRTPSGKTRAFRIQIASLVGNIVHKPHERIERAHRNALLFSQAVEG